MSFSTLIFVAGFLPVFILVYWLTPTVKGKNMILLLFSLLFYAFAGVKYLLLLILMTGISCLFGKGIERRKKKAEQEASAHGGKVLLVLAVALNLVVLGVFKYTAFFVSQLSLLTGTEILFPKLALPLGISFYSFKLLSYLTDIYSGRLSSQSFFSLLLYTVNFHQIAQGPIVRFTEMKEELKSRRFDPEDVSRGALRFLAGLAKKTILADHAGTLAGSFLPLDFLSNTAVRLSVQTAWLAALCYMLQIYLDFSAYSDMALGLGQICGFHYPENFNYPYAARSVRDFWRRWHISLSAFFRDYVYIPLGGSRVSLPRLAENLLVVWGLTGFWHGASWNFLFWGLYYFVFLFFENLFRRGKREDEKERKTMAETEAEDFGREEAAGVSERTESDDMTGGRKLRFGALLAGLFGHAYTLLVVYFGWVLFRFSDFKALFAAGKLMFGGAEWTDPVSTLLLKNNLFFLLAALFACTPAVHQCNLWMTGRMTELRGKYLRHLERARRTEEPQYSESFQDSGNTESSFAVTEERAEKVLKTSMDEHEKTMLRVRRRLAKQNRRARYAENLYYLERTILGLLLLVLSIMAMVGGSYMPFLYNQF